MDTRTLALEVVLMWDGAPVRAELWSTPGKVTVGDAEGADFVLPREAIGEAFTLAERVAGEDAWIVRIPAGASALLEQDEAAGPRAIVLETLPAEADGARLLRCTLGTRAQVRLGAFSLFVRATTPAEKTPAAPLVRLADHRWLLASVAVHGAFLAGMFFMPPASSALMRDTDTSRLRMLRYSIEAAERAEPEPLDAPDTESGAQSEGRASEAGTAGARDETRHTGGGARARGPSEDSRIPLTRESVRTAGILGALAAMRLDTTVSSPFGAAEALGAGTVDAYGDLAALTAGFSSGTGGLSMHGIGRGGGCQGGVCGAGTYGLGEFDGIGARTGTCGADEFRRLSAELGRARAMDQCTGTVERSIGLGTTRRTRVPPQPMPTVSTVNGLSREQIRRTVQRHLPEVRHCYEQRLITRPDLEGRVSVQFVIAQSGAVQGAVVDGARSDLGDAQTASCVAQAVSRWSFTASEGVTSVTYPFVFARPE
jgi:hypothetical protein